MACQDCYCGRKEMEEAGRKVPETSCGPGPIDALLQSYEYGDMDRETFLKALEMAVGSK